MNLSFFKKNRFLLPLAALNIVLLVAVVFLINHVQNLLGSDIKIVLTEVVTQNKNIITSRIMMDINQLNSVANIVSEQLKAKNLNDYKDIQKFLLEYSEQNQDDSLFIADNTGFSLVKGKELNIFNRKYFRLAMSGTPNISDKSISRVNGEDIFIFSVPLYYKDEIIGTVQKYYSAEQMHNLFALSLFSSKGYVYVINSEGYVILHTYHTGCPDKSDNYFRTLYEDDNREASNQIRTDVQNNRSGFQETTINQEQIFSAYTPIPGIHDWYLITCVPTEAISPNGTNLVKLFFIILSSLTFIFTSSVAYFQRYKNKQKEALEQIAFVDPVTEGNTFNKFAVDVSSILLSNPNTKFWIFKFDIDNFKYINNFYGFEFGDKVLRQIDNTFSSKLNKNEVCARVSSDNFVALLTDVHETRLNDLLTFTDPDEDLQLYFSGGLYAINDKTENINLMLDKAGIASQTVKGSLNKKFNYYSDEFDKYTRQNEQLKRVVKQAIVDKSIFPYYQPKVDINTGTVVGAEALARMYDKDGRFIVPGEFIPLCEKTGLIMDVDMIIFEKVLLFIRNAMDSGSNCVPISVNFSRLHLADPTFIDKITDKVNSYKVPANLIEIELTESAIFDNVDIIYDITQKLRSRGFLLAMDDFGSGYSSLNMLKDIPIDVLKIDKGFLSEAIDSNRRNIIFSTIAEMASKLNIKVVVEGVEYAENVQLMKDCGCSIAQGYYFARPMDEKSFEKIYRDGVV